MAVNGRYALCRRKDASFGADHKNWNEDRPTLSAAKNRPMTLVSGGVTLVLEGASNDSGIVENGNFQHFRWLFFGNFRDEASVIIQRYAVHRRLFSYPKLKMHDLE